MRKNMLQNYKKYPKKSYEFYYDDVSEHYVFEIKDTEGVFPLFLKKPVSRTYELVLTQHNSLQMK
jgi:hypothetical protein